MTFIFANEHFKTFMIYEAKIQLPEVKNYAIDKLL